MLAGLVGHADAAQHAGNLFHAFVGSKHAEHRSRRLAVSQLGDTYMGVRLTGDLRQVGDA
jgi:hypothetical protein